VLVRIEEALGRVPDRIAWQAEDQVEVIDPMSDEEWEHQQAEWARQREEAQRGMLSSGVSGFSPQALLSAGWS
jgi:hypothetical protein